MLISATLFLIFHGFSNSLFYWIIFSFCWIVQCDLSCFILIGKFFCSEGFWENGKFIYFWIKTFKTLCNFVKREIYGYLRGTEREFFSERFSLLENSLLNFLFKFLLTKKLSLNVFIKIGKLQNVKLSEKPQKISIGIFIPLCTNCISFIDKFPRRTDLFTKTNKKNKRQKIIDKI